MNIFKRRPASETVLSMPEKSKPKNLVEEIHMTFDEAMDRILEDAKIERNIPALNQNLQTKVEQLKALGFSQTPEIKALEQQIEDNNQLARINKINQQTIKDLSYLQMRYPYHKIITRDAWESICNKYQLGWGAVRFFQGHVPQKNLEDILKVKIADEDKVYISKDAWRGTTPELNFRTVAAYYGSHRQSNFKLGDDWIPSPLIIAAPPKDFSDELQRDKLGQLKPLVNLDDPIVGQMIQVQHREYVLIITAWGPEAMDPEIFNQQNN